MLNDLGSLAIRALTGGAIPVGDAIVRITGAQRENAGFARSLLTDRDGMTAVIALPAPSERFSFSPRPTEPPFAVYNVEITKNGYYPKRIFGITVFAGVESLQIINMIPASLDAPEIYPKGNITVIIPNYEITE